jgi:hypothetical protein
LHKDERSISEKGLGSKNSQSGFALPSVLMLVVLLSLVAFSVLLLQHIRYLNAVADVARVKAELAAQSGVAYAATGRRAGEGREVLGFADSSRATVRTLPWGVMKLAIVQGVSGRITASRTAILGGTPPPEYKHALCFGNPSHQLILTGSTQITGDVAVGSMGVTVGTLPGEKQPAHLPVSGNLWKKPGIPLPEVNRQMLDACFAPFVSFLGGVSPSPEMRGLPQNPANASVGTSPTIPDSVETISLSGDMLFDLNVIRRERPLFVHVRGGLVLAQKTVVEGAVAFYVTGPVRIEGGARIDNAVIMSGDSIFVENGLTMRGQLIAPLITVGMNCTFTYPSVVCSYPFAGTKNRRIEFAAGDQCEGLVIVFRQPAATQWSMSHSVQDLLSLHRDATVVGAVYTEAPATIDGTVIGSVLVSDLYFYQAPTAYFGWLRLARIDRLKLPDGLAVPPCLGTGEGEVVEWL